MSAQPTATQTRRTLLSVVQTGRQTQTERRTYTRSQDSICRCLCHVEAQSAGCRLGETMDSNGSVFLVGPCGLNVHACIARSVLTEQVPRPTYTIHRMYPSNPRAYTRAHVRTDRVRIRTYVHTHTYACLSICLSTNGYIGTGLRRACAP